MQFSVQTLLALVAASATVFALQPRLHARDVEVVDELWAREVDGADQLYARDAYAEAYADAYAEAIAEALEDDEPSFISLERRRTPKEQCIQSCVSRPFTSRWRRAGPVSGETARQSEIGVAAAMDKKSKLTELMPIDTQIRGR